MGQRESAGGTAREMVPKSDSDTRAAGPRAQAGAPDVSEKRLSWSAWPECLLGLTYRRACTVHEPEPSGLPLQSLLFPNDISPFPSLLFPLSAITLCEKAGTSGVVSGLIPTSSCVPAAG